MYRLIPTLTCLLFAAGASLTHAEDVFDRLRKQPLVEQRLKQKTPEMVKKLDYEIGMLIQTAGQACCDTELWPCPTTSMLVASKSLMMRAPGSSLDCGSLSGRFVYANYTAMLRHQYVVWYETTGPIVRRVSPVTPNRLQLEFTKQGNFTLVGTLQKDPAVFVVSQVSLPTVDIKRSTSYASSNLRTQDSVTENKLVRDVQSLWNAQNQAMDVDLFVDQLFGGKFDDSLVNVGKDTK